MTFTREQRDLLEDLRRKRRVHFRGSVPALEWPPNHRLSFAAIQSLGDLKYHNYSVEAKNDLGNEPWKNRAGELAVQLTERAARCCRRNEASWRFACEPLIFARLNADVACPQCRGRMWRSEIEASWDGDSQRAVALRKRQESRRPCRCPRSTRQNDHHEAIGLNRIFTHREQESIFHPAALAKELTRGEQPDRIYGLRQTRNFEEALYAKAQSEPSESDRLVRDVLTVSPLSLDGDPLLFPFLVLEAKSGKSEDDWHSIKLQTAFPIRTCLDVQHGLQAATTTQCRWQSGPLVWFFMNKGEDWQLCAAYIQKNPLSKGIDDAIDYHILDLWNGSILTKDGALQLLLIVDFIFDWARDTYRQDILTELRVLSRGTEEVASIFPDSDLMSTRETIIPEMPGHAVGEDPEGWQRIRSGFHACDSPMGTVRHAEFIETRFCMLFITRDNVQTLLQSTNANTVQLLARWILAQISEDAFSMGIDTLDALEEQWTGTARFSRSFDLVNTKFFTAFSFGTYMTTCWEQARELYVIAVAEDAFDSLVGGSKLHPGRGKAQKPKPYLVDGAVITRTVSHFHGTSPQHTLLAAIKRMLLRARPSSLTEDLDLISDDGTLRNIVHFVYKSFKRGILEPSESFLRVSSRHERIRTDSPDTSPYPLRFEELQLSDRGAVLVWGRGPNSGIQWSKQSSICIYFVEAPLEVPNQSSLATAIKDTFENYDVYHTTRDNGTCNIKSTRSSSRASWNLNKPYGIYTENDGFVRWLEHLGSDPPRRQGSPRDPSGSGQYLLRRNITPWHDPRLIGRSRDYEIFLLYMLMTTELLYWRGVARKRKEQGIKCCQACATTKYLMGDPEDNVCPDCWEEIKAPIFPRWVSDALAGKESIGWTQVEKQHYSKADLILEKPGWWHDSISTDYGDLPPQEQWYKDLSEYPNLDKEFVDMRELWKQAERYGKYRYDTKYPGARRALSLGTRKRTRFSSGSDTE